MTGQNLGSPYVSASAWTTNSHTSDLQTGQASSLVIVPGISSFLIAKTGLSASVSNRSCHLPASSTAVSWPHLVLAFADLAADTGRGLQLARVTRHAQCSCVTCLVSTVRAAQRIGHAAAFQSSATITSTFLSLLHPIHKAVWKVRRGEVPRWHRQRHTQPRQYVSRELRSYPGPTLPHRLISSYRILPPRPPQRQLSSI